MTDFIIVIVLVAILGGAITYIVKAKKSGVKCIGCPSGATCGGNCGGNCEGSCNSNHDQQSVCKCDCRSNENEEKSEI